MEHPKAEDVLEYAKTHRDWGDVLWKAETGDVLPFVELILGAVQQAYYTEFMIAQEHGYETGYANGVEDGTSMADSKWNRGAV